MGPVLKEDLWSDGISAAGQRKWTQQILSRSTDRKTGWLSAQSAPKHVLLCNGTPTHPGIKGKSTFGFTNDKRGDLDLQHTGDDGTEEERQWSGCYGSLLWEIWSCSISAVQLHSTASWFWEKRQHCTMEAGMSAQSFHWRWEIVKALHFWLNLPVDVSTKK